MTKQFRLMFNVPSAELQSFTASLEEAGFSQVSSSPVEYKTTPDADGLPDEMDFR